VRLPNVYARATLGSANARLNDTSNPSGYKKFRPQYSYYTAAMLALTIGIYRIVAFRFIHKCANLYSTRSFDDLIEKVYTTSSVVNSAATVGIRTNA
jgi:hypothetical protein